MHKIFSIFILLLCGGLTAFSQLVPVGSGSYTTTFPGTDEAGRNTFPTGTPQLSGVAASKPVPTNDWWSNFVKVDHGGQAFNYPLSFRSVPDGLVVNYTIPGSGSATEYRQPMSDVKAIVVGLDGLNATRSTVASHSDWTVTMNWASGGRSFSATMGMGMPFVYFTKSSGDIAKINLGFNPAGATVNGNKIIIRGNMNSSDFVVFGPAGSGWSGSNGIFTSSLGGKTYWSVAMVPPGMDVNTFISNYERYAHVHPEDTRATWAYNESTSVLRTNFSVTPDVKEGPASTVLLGLLPHQWGNLASDSPQPNLATYKTVRGQLRLLGGNSFAVENKFSGVLPTLPDLGKYSSGFDIIALNQKVNSIKGDGLPGWTDSYNEGQNMNRLIQAARIANQIGNIAARDQMLATVQERLEDWLSAEGGEKAFLFYYNSDWDALLGYPAGHSQDSNLNDHHFHWGYFIHAAAALEQFKPGWAAKWGPMIELLIRDAANPSRTDSMFPYLRNFSPYAGHAWANGFATEPFGNDQESTSESMQFNASLIHWGTITNNKAIRDLGIYLYTTEVTAVQEYWFDIHDRTFQPEYAHEMVARIWSAGYDNGTWWTSDIAASYGIQLYPIHGGSLYMGYDTDYVSEVWEGMKAKTEVLSNTPNANLWYDTYWSFLAFLDPAEAIRLYNDYTNRDVKVGMSDAQTYHWLHTMNAMGQVADEITADYPVAAVFMKDGVKTYVAHNYGSADRTVRFSDGTTLFAPAGKMSTNRDSGITISLTAPGVTEEPCTTGVNNNFTLQAATDGTVSRIEFFRNGSLVATDNSTPFELAQSFTTDGVHNYLAKAYNGSNFSNSNVVQVIVGLGAQAPYTTAHAVPGTFESGHYDKGGQGISYFDGDPNVYEANFRPEDEVDAATSDSQGTSVGWTSPGEWLEYSVNATTAGTYSVGLNIASNQDEGGMSGSLSLFLDCNEVGAINSTPLTSSWDTYQEVSATNISVPAGRHILRVRFNSGVFNLGKITFTRTGGDTNGSPTVSISSPSDGSAFTEGETITINASASDADGTVSLVEFYASGVRVGQDNIAPYSFNWTNVAEGTYRLTARATDNGGAVTTSSPVSVTVEKSGGNGFTIPGTIQAEDYTTMSGVELEGTTDAGGGQNVGWIDAGDWMDYPVNVTTAGTYTLNFRVASANGGGQLQLRSGTSTLASVNIAATGGWQNWTTVSATATLAAGSQTIRLYASSGGFNLNWTEFVQEAQPVLTSIRVSPATATIDINGTQQLIAQGFDQNGNAMAANITWSATAGTVNSSGLYTGTTAGTHTVRATSGSVSGSANITVNAAVGFTIPGTIQAEDYAAMNGVQLEGTTDAGGGQNVGWIDAGDWMDYPVNVTTAGTYTLNFRVASANGGGQLQLRSGTSTLASVNIAATGGWQIWTTVSATATLAAGSQTIRLYASYGGFNLNWTEFISNGDGSGTCTFTAANDDYSAEVSADAGNPSITFVPSRAGVGSSTVILYYGTSATGGLAGYTTSANQPFQINAAEGQTIYFYYTYNVPEGGERNTSASRHNFTVGSCTSNASIAARPAEKMLLKVQSDPGVYPNPVGHNLHFQNVKDLKGGSFTILDAVGRSVLNNTFSGQQVDVASLSPGMYTIAIQKEEKKTFIRFVKE